MQNSIQLPVIKIAGSTVNSGPDMLAIEEPLEIRLAYGSPAGSKLQNLAVTMRTPGDDMELALGFLFTEGIVTGRSEVSRVDHVFVPCSENKQNVIQVTLNEGIIPNLLQAGRNFYTSSSCGVCGKASISAIRTVRSFETRLRDKEPIHAGFIFGLPAILAKQQRIFADTGGLHAAALFSEEGEALLAKEDVGRHNALDKLIGAALMAEMLPLAQAILLLSGRASFELIQKAAMAGIPVIAAVGAPSSLAVSLAEEFGITLIGFLRHDRFNIYSAEHRIKMPVHENTH
jgi:FdhD protein